MGAVPVPSAHTRAARLLCNACCSFIPLSASFQPSVGFFFFCNQKNFSCCFSCLSFLSDGPSSDHPGFVQGG